MSGYDSGQTATSCVRAEIKGRKRHIVTDTHGFLVFVLIHAADIQDRDGPPYVLKAIRRRFPWLRHIFADGGYAGSKLRQAMRGHGDWTIEIVKRSDQAKGFVVLPKRWVVERTFAGFGRCRRLAKDWEKSIESATAWARIASIRMLTRRIARCWIYE
ncbi:IS4 insertion sequence transposase (plasmid) [Rhizobium sp. CCGE 510]|nr:IS4 insertion sequence transposase [Rhizobium sp. CCGE 510]